MKIIIEGAGQVGTHLAKMLSADGGDVTIIDDDAERIRILSTSADVTTLQGPSSSISLLKEAGCDHTDLFIAVNPFKDQSVNIVSALLAKKLGAKRVIARIDDEDYLFPENKLLFKDMGLDLVFYPEKSASDEILQLLSHTAANDSLDFARGKLQLAVFKLEEDSPLLDMNVAEFSRAVKQLQADADFRIVAISRSGTTLIPKFDTVFKDYDYLYVDDVKCVNSTVGIKAVARAASGLKLGVQGASLNISVAKSGTMKVQVFDMMGNVVKTVSESVTSGMHQVSLETLTRGNYVVRVMSGSDSKTARFSIR